MAAGRRLKRAFHTLRMAAVQWGIGRHTAARGTTSLPGAAQQDTKPPEGSPGGGCVARAARQHQGGSLLRLTKARRRCAQAVFQGEGHCSRAAYEAK